MRKSTFVVLVAVGLASCGGDEPGAIQSTVPDTGLSAVSVTKDVVYATSMTEDGTAGEVWDLDVYAPANASELPVIVLLHGLNATKEIYSVYSEPIAGFGAIVYAINGPVKPASAMTFDHGTGFREMSEVLACAIGYARTTAPDFGGDSDRVVLVGHSWGALYGAWFALGSDSLAADWEQYAADHGGPPAQAHCELGSSEHVEGFIGVGGGGYDDVEQEQLPDRYPDLEQVVSPYSRLGQNLDLPIRLLVGDQERAQMLETSLDFNEDLLEAGHDSQRIVFEGGHIVPPEATYETAVQMTGN